MTRVLLAPARLREAGFDAVYVLQVERGQS